MRAIRATVAALALMLAGGAAQAEAVATGPGALLRVLDKITGQHEDLRIANGASAAIWRMQIDLGECRYPVDNPSGDAYAFVTVRETGHADPAFRGWMIASAPALNAMDHARYDVWVIRCTTS